ncbi:hypothetical protein BJF86_13370 [Serinicoccus sp. CNJ-927]|uniref:ParA family protein n=1 Tax=Serinicoccus sp. CNJ-927 TaxID=1904970 RepID=UPI0009613D77|nr:ParA family protein [Serinicoccus sp. CNJ-927]OLT43944.1 hypothetical protein BJF86_13370 [Serinicoccus sp. CNJ-927]
MDQWSEALSRVVLVANRKGGVLKSSVCRSVAGVAAGEGLRVLAVDGDPQGNLSGVDFGLEGDRGRNLAMAMQYGSEIVPTQVSDQMHVVCGGPELQGALGASLTPGAEVSLEENLRAALGRLCEMKGYDLVLVDSGPGDTRLLDAYMAASRWLVVPTIWDEGSLAGVETVGARYARAVKAGSEIELLGAVLTKVDPAASKQNREVLEDLAAMLGDVPPFTSTIRYKRAEAADARRYGLSAREVSVEAVRQRRSRLEGLRARANGQKAQGDSVSWWSRGSKSGTGLADDYEALTREILTRMRERSLV